MADTEGSLETLVVDGYFRILFDAVPSPVLIVDDEAIVRESIRDWLTESGYRVTTASSGEEALKLFAEQDFGVVVLDIRLPGMTGLKPLQEIRAIRPGVKAIMITAYPTAELNSEAVKLGALDFVIKPVAPEDLERLIKKALADL